MASEAGKVTVDGEMDEARTDEAQTDEALRALAEPRRRAILRLAELREFLDQMWASSLEIARDLVEADRGTAGSDQAPAAMKAHVLS
jgi:DNA-binding transcriptional ArsR family regulator